MRDFSLIGIVFVFLASANILHANDEKHSPIIAAYFENYSPSRPASGNRQAFSLSMVDPNLLTDIYYAFGTFGFVTKSIDPSNPHLTGDFKLQPTEANDLNVLYPQIQALKKLSKNGLKLILSLGGWNFNDPNDPEGAGKSTYHLFSQMVSTEANRKQFIDSAISYAHLYGFDGIDIDWEYPGDKKRGGVPEDFANFLNFLKEASAAFSQTKPPLILSYAAPAAIPSNIPEEHKQGYFKWIAECSKYLDRIGLMTYDYHGPFDVSKITGVNAPLNRDTNPSSQHYIAKTLQNYLDIGVPASKIILGMPTFGHSYAGVSELQVDNTAPGKPFETGGAPGPSTQLAGFLAYFEVSDMIKKQQLTFGTDSVTSTALGFNLSTKNWVSFDTPDTIKLKAELVLKHHLAGVMFWSLDNDEYQWEPRFPNIRAARGILYPGQ